MKNSNPFIVFTPGLASITGCLLCLGISIAPNLGLVSTPNGQGAASGAKRPWMNPSLSAEKRADLLLRAMNLDDKIAMLHGGPSKGPAGAVPANPRLGIPALCLADGRAGVGNGARDVTLLPAPLAAAASWNPALLFAYGKVLGNEEWKKGVNVFLGPTIDVVRVPEWGRAFETYGEDPYFNSQMAAAEINGVQSEGPIANANMYLTMNQETDRGKVNCVVGERTLQEIYLPPFRAAIQAGNVGTVMGAYVKTDGSYSCQNRHLLHDFLRTELGFKGWVLSDWGAVHSTLDCLNAGLDQEMPGGRYYGKPLALAVQAGEVSTPTLNRHVRRILVTMFRHGLFDRPPTGTWHSNARSAADDLFARKAAEEGTVLLKNEGHILPLANPPSIAVIGADGGTKAMAEGGGSSGVVAPYVVSPLEGIRQRAPGIRVSYADGSDVSQAAKNAQAAGVAIVFVSAFESEGADRPNLELPGNQDQLVSAVAAANSNTVVVLNTGGAVLMPWLGHVRAVIEAWYPGQEDGHAIAAVLFGDVNPSGRLALTFPRTNDEVPTASPRRWPGISRGKPASRTSEYTEALNVGYRWYAATRTRPLFPFGYGLSYTTFKLAGPLVLTRDRLESSPGKASVAVTVNVTNSGRRAGSEVVQAYIGHPAANGEPPLQLCGFAKVLLHPGQTEPVRIVLNPWAFSIFDTAANRWTSPPGAYDILIGASSRDLPLQTQVTVEAKP